MTGAPDPVQPDLLCHEAGPGDVMRCTVGHFDERGGCYHCIHCRRWVRPSAMGQRCLERIFGHEVVQRELEALVQDARNETLTGLAEAERVLGVAQARHAGLHLMEIAGVNTQGFLCQITHPQTGAVLWRCSQYARMCHLADQLWRHENLEAQAPRGHG